MKFQLGQRLLDSQIISEDQLQRGLEHKKSAPGKIGTHLVELGFFKPTGSGKKLRSGIRAAGGAGS